MKTFFAAHLLLLLPLIASAQSVLHTAKPLTPEQARAALVVEAGLRVDLAAAEPLVASPCAVAWDERGRMFVAENRGYPTGPGTNVPPAGIIAMLESTKGDGVYDKRTVFADGLTFPNGICCWRGGILVTCAPDIIFLKDTDGDGRADVRKVVLTGFGTNSTTQLRVSHPTLGLDGWIHLTAGLVGGKVRSPEHPERAAVEFARSDTRFHPDTFEFETEAGVGQFGLAYDDFGRKFTCSNRNPLQHVVLQPRYLKRNPHLAFSETVQDVAPPGDAGKVWPLSEDQTTAAFIPSLMSTPHAGTFTSACGISIWRGGALPESFTNSAFVCEPAQNLVQRQVIAPDGPTFKSAPATPGREFLATKDSWFRPVFSATGPDGALYICDMYRKVIDHPQYLPEHIRGSLDYEAGKTMGRIYRVTATSSKTQAPSSKLNLAASSNGELVAKLNDANGWVRSTAFRLLLERKDTNADSIAALRQLWLPKYQEFTIVFGQRRTLMTWGHLNGQAAGAASAFELSKQFGAVQPADLSRLVTGLQSQPGEDRAARTVAAVIGAAGADLLARSTNRLSSSFGPNSLWADGAMSLAWALAYGDRTNAPPAEQLVRLLANSPTNRWLRAAVLSSASKRSVELLAATRKLAGPFRVSGGFYQDLAPVLVAESEPPQIAKAFRQVLEELPERVTEGAKVAFATGLGNGARAKGLGKDGRSALVTLASANPDTARRLGELFSAATKSVASATTPTPERLAAIDLLAHSDFATAGAALQSLIAPQVPNELQAAAVRALSQLPGAQAGEWLVARERWRSYTPPVRDAVLNAMLSQPALQLALLDAVETGVVQPWAVPANRRGPLLNHKDAAVKARAAKAFQPQGAADRMKVFEEHKSVLKLAANAKNGHAVFTKTCAACHQFAGEGAKVGPDLTGVRLQPAEALLLHILVPDAEIYPGFTAYEIETRDGRTLTGLLASDSPTSVTLRAAQGIEETLLRSNIAKMTSSSNSLMPNELEKTMSRQELADLIAFLKGM